MKRIKRLFGSVFTRLLAATVVAGLTITIVVIVGFIGIRIHSENTFQRNLQLYAEYLTRDLGNPPDERRAKEIARRTNMVIKFVHPAYAWQTGPLPRFLNFERAWIHKLSSGLQMGSSKGHHFLRIAYGGGELIFAPVRDVHHGEEALWILSAISLALTAILSTTYYFIRSTLKPLNSLKTGVDALGQGKLEHRIPETGCTELSDLAFAFNQMVRQLDQLLASKEQLLLDVSHELRSPLTRLKVQLEFLEDVDAREALGSDVAEMESMVTSILESARLRNTAATLNLQAVTMAEVIRTLVVEFKDRPPGIALQSLVDIQIQADPEKMRIVIRNLLDNALKHTPEDGEKVEISMEAKTDVLEIIVKDRGAGIPGEALPFIFEPFYRPDRSRSRKTGGFGLGLSLCKAIMDAHGGSIALESNDGEGTIVTVSLSR